MAAQKVLFVKWLLLDGCRSQLQAVPARSFNERRQEMRSPCYEIKQTSLALHF